MPTLSSSKRSFKGLALSKKLFKLYPKEQTNINYNLILNIKGMTCSHCQESVTSAIYSNKNIRSASVDISKSKAYILGENIDPDKISAIDKENMRKSKVFLENVKNAKANAAKVAKKIIKEELPKQTLKKTDFSKKTVVMMRMRDGLAKLYNKIPLKGVRLGASSAAAVLDYSFFHYVPNYKRYKKWNIY